MTHTPGPWHQHTQHPERIILNGSAGYEVHHAWDENLGPNPADVRLMAAAPELLAALKALVNHCVRNINVDVRTYASILAAADRAIYQAEWGSPQKEPAEGGES